MRIASWIIKATDTHSEYVTLTAFPQQQSIDERATVLRSHVHCLQYVSCLPHLRNILTTLDLTC